MPITYWTCVVNVSALIRFPGTSGLFSPRIHCRSRGLLARVGSGRVRCWSWRHSHALYTFRMFIMTFFLGRKRMDPSTPVTLCMKPLVVTAPLILLAIPSALIGWFTVKPCCAATSSKAPVSRSGDTVLGAFGKISKVLCIHLDCIGQLPVWRAGLGGLTGYQFFIWRPTWADRLSEIQMAGHHKLGDTFGFDWFTNPSSVAGPGCWRRPARFAISS